MECCGTRCPCAVTSPGCVVPMALLPSSGHLPLASACLGLWSALREGFPLHGSSKTKGWGKKANRQVLEDFPQHSPRIKKAKHILPIKTTTLQCNIKDYLLKRLWMLRWEVFPSTDAPSMKQRQKPATSSLWCFIVLLLEPKTLVILHKQRSASAVAIGGWSLRAGCGRFAALKWRAQGSRGTTTIRSHLL